MCKTAALGTKKLPKVFRAAGKKKIEKNYKKVLTNVVY